MKAVELYQTAILIAMFFIFGLRATICRTMRIGIDARMYSSEFTGIGRYVYELIENIQAVDDKNEYVIFMNPEEFAKFEPKSKRVSKVMVRAHHYSFGEQVSFLRILKKAKLDLMHFTHFNVPIFIVVQVLLTMISHFLSILGRK